MASSAQKQQNVVLGGRFESYVQGSRYSKEPWLIPQSYGVSHVTSDLPYLTDWTLAMTCGHDDSTINIVIGIIIITL